VKAAIKRGELPKAKSAPNDATEAVPGDIWLPAGALTDWAEGTTAQTYQPLGPGYAVPALGALLGGDFAGWDIRPDSDAPAVRERRQRICDAFLTVRTIPKEDRMRAPSIDPPLTAKERERARKLADERSEAFDYFRPLAIIALHIATTHATHRAQFQDVATAIETIRRDDFGGEDPLWPEVRDQLEMAETEAERFAETWAAAHDIMRIQLREAAGLEGFPADSWNPETKTFDIPPAPLPEGDHDRDGTLSLIYDWAT